MCLRPYKRLWVRVTWSTPWLTCVWDEYRRTGTVAGYPAYGVVVAQLLRVYGIDIQKIARA